METKTETIYIDLARKFSYCLYEGKKYTHVAYDYNSNAIIVCSQPKRFALNFVNTFQSIWNMLKRNIEKHNLVYRTTMHQAPSKTSLSINPPTTSLLHQEQRDLFKLSKIVSSVLHAQLTEISLCNYGTNSYLRLKTPSTCSALHGVPSKLTYANFHGKYNFKTHPWAPLNAKQLYMNICNLVRHGAQEELMYSTLDQQWSLSILPHVYCGH